MAQHLPIFLLGHRILVTDDRFLIIVSTLSILTGLIVPHVFSVIKISLGVDNRQSAAVSSAHTTTPRSNGNPQSLGQQLEVAEANEDIELLGLNTPAATVARRRIISQETRDAVQAAGGLENAIVSLPAGIFERIRPGIKHGPRTLKEWLADVKYNVFFRWRVILEMSFLTLVFSALFVGAIIAGTYGAPGINVGRFGVASSLNPGLWMLSVPFTEYAPQAPFYNQPAQRAHHYRKTCYRHSGNGRNSVGMEDDGNPLCKTLARKNISYEVTHSYPCPFPVNEAFPITKTCYLGLNSSFYLSTGLQSVAELGINGDQDIWFKRSMIGVPLLVDPHGSRVVHLRYDNLTSWEISYNFGPLIILLKNGNGLDDDSFEIKSNVTYRASSKKSSNNWYNYGIFERTLYEPEYHQHIWFPLQEFQIPKRENDFLWLLIVDGGLNINYSGKQKDPIYPVTMSQPESSTLYSRPNILATALAIVDSIELHDRKSGIRYGPSTTYYAIDELIDKISNDVSRGAFTLAYMALKAGRNLAKEYFIADKSQPLSNRYIGNFLTSHVGDDMWKRELMEVFEFSLAHTQLYVRDVGTGKDAHKQGYTPYLRQKDIDRIGNGLVKIGITSKTSLHLPGLLCYSFVLFVLMVMRLFIGGSGYKILRGLKAMFQYIFKSILIVSKRCLDGMIVCYKAVVGYINKVRLSLPRLKLTWTIRRKDDRGGIRF